MDSPKSDNTTPIAMPESKATAKGKAPADAPAPVTVTTKATPYPQGKWKKGVAIFDFIFRLCAIGAAFAATATMGTTEQILPFFTQFLQFHAQYNDLPAFTSFVIANATAAAYLVLSLPFSIVCIVRPHAIRPRLILATFDIVMVAVTISGASGAAAIVYLAQNGNSNANWNAICQQFGDFCASASSAVVASYVAALMFMFLVVLSALALKRT